MNTHKVRLNIESDEEVEEDEEKEGDGDEMQGAFIILITFVSEINNEEKTEWYFNLIILRYKYF